MLILVAWMLLQIRVKFLRHKHDVIDAERTVSIVFAGCATLHSDVRSIRSLCGGALASTIVAYGEGKIAHIDRINLGDIVLKSRSAIGLQLLLLRFAAQIIVSHGNRYYIRLNVSHVSVLVDVGRHKANINRIACRANPWQIEDSLRIRTRRSRRYRHVSTIRNSARHIRILLCLG